MKNSKLNLALYSLNFKFVSLVVLGAFLLALVPPPAQASPDTETLRPNGVGNSTNFSQYPVDWLGDWLKRVKITIDSADIGEDVTHFPVLIHLSSTCGKGGAYDLTPVFSEVGGNSKRIAVTKADEVTQLYVEIEKWDASAEEAWLWVSKSDWTISSTADTDIYLYYDNSQPDNNSWVGDSGSRTEVWDGDFQGVWHLRETTGGSNAFKDSTGTYHGTDAGTVSLGQTGKIGNAVSFDAAADLIDCGDIDAIDGIEKMTWEAWVKPSSLADYQAALVKDNGAKNIMWLGSSGGGQGGNDDVAFGVEDGSLNVFAYSTTNVLDTTNWHYLTGRFDGTEAVTTDRERIYHNGVDVTGGHFNGAWCPATTPSGTGTFDIGTDGPQGVDYWRGIVDEVRASSVARTDAWIKASYESGRDDLLDFGSEETGGNFDKVDEETQDGNTTYVYTSSSVYDTYATQDHSAGSGTINSVTIHAWVARATGAMTTGYTVVRTEGTDHQGSGTFINSFEPNYEEITTEYTDNPSTNEPWTWTQVDNMEIGCGRSNGTVRCTQVFAVVDYTPATLGISVDPSSYNFGTVTVNSETVATTTITVTNTGNVTETYNLKLTNPGGWTAVSTVPVSEEYRLESIFNSSAPASTDFDDANDFILTTPTTCSDTKFAGDETGASVPEAGTRSLWFQFEAPSSTTVTAEQTITVTIGCQAP